MSADAPTPHAADALKPVRQEPLETPPAGPRVGRNNSCPCGSGRKFRRCCGR
ncbi:MAG: hypothetical protein GXY25_17365 [Pirellulaceae bacterium]|nr:hypothetical protein [Pirellulaceae bacterium]